MPFGYIGQNQTKQKIKNSGVLSSFEVSHLEKQGHAGGSLELIEEVNITSSTAYQDFTNLGNYDIHYLTISGIDTDGSADRYMRATFFESGVEETASVYEYAHQYGFSSNSFGEAVSTGNSAIIFGSNHSNASNSLSNNYIYFYNLKNSSKYSFMTYTGVSMTHSSGMLMNFGAGVLPQKSTVDTIRFKLNNDNITSANFKLFGVKEI